MYNTSNGLFGSCLTISGNETRFTILLRPSAILGPFFVLLSRIFRTKNLYCLARNKENNGVFLLVCCICNFFPAHSANKPFSEAEKIYIEKLGCSKTLFLRTNSKIIKLLERTAYLEVVLKRAKLGSAVLIKKICRIAYSAHRITIINGIKKYSL